jgi:16S rRNA (cytosine1402-N4)-methyltransferase
MMVGGTPAPALAAVSLKQQSPAKMASVSTHITVLLNEAVDALNIKPSGTYIDGTFGRGGHGRLILSKLDKNGVLFAIDRDLAAVETGKTILDARFKIEHRHFSEINQLAISNNLTQVDGILLDLGISSPQIDEGERGFSFRFNAPLDMRMDQSCGKTVAELLTTISEQQLGKVIKDYGEERFAKQVARAIIKERNDHYRTACRDRGKCNPQDRTGAEPCNAHLSSFTDFHQFGA